MTTNIIYYHKPHRELTAENKIGCLIKNGGEENLHALNKHKSAETSVPTQKASSVQNNVKLPRLWILSEDTFQIKVEQWGFS